MLEVGNMVDIKGRNLSYYGEVKEILDTRAVVRLKEANQPDTCKECGWPGSLSMNGGTGEIVCMRTGCGHKHGFREWDELIPVANLINVTEARKRAEVNKWLSEIRTQLRDGVSSGYIDSGKVDAIMRLLSDTLTI